MNNRKEVGPDADNDAEAYTRQCASEYIEGLGRRRAATYRVPPLECGCRDPWCHRCEPRPTKGYALAVEHLLAAGLSPWPDVQALREMWRADDRQRRIARTIAERWEVAA